MTTNIKLGEGAQGCVLSGTILLSQNPKNNQIYSRSNNLGQVTKLILDEKIFWRELQNTRKINELDDGKYSMQITAYSILTQKDIKIIMEQNHRVLQKLNLCKKISESIKSIKYLFQILYKDEGISVTSLKISPERMIILCYNLYEGLQLYYNNDFLHYDVKIDNILYVKDKLLFIDFGHSSTVQKVNLSYISQIPNNYSNYYLHDPPEVIALAVILYSPLDKEKNFELFQTIYEHNLQSNTMSGVSFKQLIVNNIYEGSQIKYMQALRSLYEYIYKLPNNMSRESFVRKYISYIDIYKLSMTMLEIFEMNKYIHQNHKLITDFYMNVVFKCITINPTKRESIENICNTYRTLLQNIPISKSQESRRFLTSLHSRL